MKSILCSKIARPGQAIKPLLQVQQYLWDEDSLGLDYVGATMTMDPAKSCMRDRAMSKFSPWLAHGCLSPRKLYEETGQS